MLFLFLSLILSIVFKFNSYLFIIFLFLCEFVPCGQLFYKAERPREGGISCGEFQDMDGSGALVTWDLCI